MTFEAEMNRFFKGYSPEDRVRVESDPRFQKAVAKGNAVRALEIAVEIIEGNANNRGEAKTLKILNEAFK